MEENSGLEGPIVIKSRQGGFKVVAQSIPTYTMGVFQLPKKLCDDLNAMCARFWWGHVCSERKIHWKSWKALSQSKKEGSMGFRDIKCFNLAMLAKQGGGYYRRMGLCYMNVLKLDIFLEVHSWRLLMFPTIHMYGKA